jgi:hypothetical protein
MNVDAAWIGGLRGKYGPQAPVYPSWQAPPFGAASLVGVRGSLVSF